MRKSYKWWVAVLVAVVLLGTSTVVYKQNKVKEANLNNQIQQLKEQSKARSEADKQKLQLREQELQQQVKELNEKLQSKAAEKARLASVEQSKTSATQKVVQSIVPTAQAATGSHIEWMAQAGIPQSDWGYVEFIVSRESGWRPCSFYPSQNDCNARPVNACGLVMQNPCGKIPGDWRDPIAALRWQKGYVQARYGGYAGAYNYWLIHHNY